MLVWASLLVALISFWWQGDKVKALVMAEVLQQCHKQDLQLLDQSMVLRGVWPARGASGKLVLRRRYNFEFTSTGAARYQGIVVFLGKNLQQFTLEPHILPDQEHDPY